ncbi:MAG: TrpB-like pyridoxal phosphate-dependent enzyme, partial [Clostridia bacterium]|nr:TrpB-like pyridoxal phosphate-dependent enzyme [Clostridia bacterium]
VGQDQLEELFSQQAAAQELDFKTPVFSIPGPVMDYYRTFRPSPLIRAYELEKALDTPARIYCKFEGNNLSGSHKLNSAAAQAYYAKAQGLHSLTTETGAGQWGTALAMACAHFDLSLTVFMVGSSARQKPQRKTLMEVFGARVVESPSLETQVGRRIREEFPGTSGSLGCAISEAVEMTRTSSHCRYALGSVLDQVLLHQSILGLECRTAMDQIGETPDLVVGCAGGGSSLGGIMAGFLPQRIQGQSSVRFLAAEAAACPSLTRGRYDYDYCDAGKQTPLAKMYTLGCDFMPSPIHAGGLRYHGMSPILSKLYHDGYMEAISVEQTKVFEAATMFAKQETILPAPESAHAIYGAVQEALKCKESGEAKTILFGLTGTGYFDMYAYQSYMDGTMKDYIPTDAELEKSFARLPKIPGIQE